ncbi:MAG: hypothetical protein KKE73_12045, partial [Proteobacteria bacterium]|nr:hypothetical protein [Pseudomonadota bacterium]
FFLVVMTFSCVEVPVKFCNSNRTPAKDGMTTFTFVANCQVITISLQIVCIISFKSISPDSTPRAEDSQCALPGCSCAITDSIPRR